MSKAKSSKNRTIKIILVSIVVAIPLLIIASCVYLFNADTSPFDAPVHLLPAYPASTLITATNKTNIEQEIKKGGNGGINYEITNGLKYQIYVTIDTIANIDNFYEDASQKAKLQLVAGGSENKYDRIFGRGANKDLLFADQYSSGYTVFSGTYYSQLIAQLVKQPTPDTKIIVLFKGW